MPTLFSLRVSKLFKLKKFNRYSSLEGTSISLCALVMNIIKRPETYIKTGFQRSDGVDGETFGVHGETLVY